MAASTHARGRATAAFQAMGPTNGGNTITQIAHYSLTANASANDVFPMIKIPAGATITDGYLKMVGIAGFAYTVGDGGDAARFVAATTVSASTTGTTVSFLKSVIPYTYDSADTIDVKMTVVAASVAQAFTLVVSYVVDGQNDGT
jgi:hypothetical protein